MSSPDTDAFSVTVSEDGTWQATCPPRRRVRTGVQATIGLVAGAILSAVAVTGSIESLNQPTWGMQLFLLGWLVPLGVVGILMAWFSWRSAQQLWQTDILESNGDLLIHRREDRSGSGPALFKMSLDRIEPFETLEQALPDDASGTLQGDPTAPLGIRYRVPDEETIYSYQSFPNIKRSELAHLTKTVNPLIEHSSEQT
jgi:hypothetical protein